MKNFILTVLILSVLSSPALACKVEVREEKTVDIYNTEKEAKEVAIKTKGEVMKTTGEPIKFIVVYKAETMTTNLIDCKEGE